MDGMDWARWALRYLWQLRTAIHSDLNDTMNELRDRAPQRASSWYATCKNVIPHFYHYSSDFVADTNIPGALYSSPSDFEGQLSAYRALLVDMKTQLEAAGAAFDDEAGPPYLVALTVEQVEKTLAAVDYVISKKIDPAMTNPVTADLDLLMRLARRFHESVLALRKHPHNGSVIEIKDEWDCQYLFKSILAAYFVHFNDEEWNPSVASISARCEFHIPSLRAMVELKYVRKAGDVKKVKTQLAEDFVDYGNNPDVDHLICLVYDPTHALEKPVAVQRDLSGSRQGLARVDVVVSPPRD
ncbi:hypothetical protein DXT96_05880 [Agrobacterium sp. ICMP 6402]|nr:hypothetical protein [Agrobacterium sp. ICMP 6402]